jgi:hypothetical protein
MKYLSCWALPNSHPATTIIVSQILLLQKKTHLLGSAHHLVANGASGSLSYPFLKTAPADTPFPIVQKDLAFFFRKGVLTNCAVDLTRKQTHQNLLLSSLLTSNP